MPMDMLSTARVADRLGVDRKTVQRMVKRGQLVPDLPTPNGPLFASATVEAYLETQRAREAVEA